jgi:VIT1/CCC1 family predicted Fe2+/Mn2+ transporter
MESWEMRGGGGVRDVIFGANDGLVSILAIVMGVYGAITESYFILLAGVAASVSGAISMGAGAYLSSKSDKEVIEKESERKGIRKKSTEEERKKLLRFYQSKGFKKKDAEAIVNRVSSEFESMKEFTIGEKIGLSSEESWSPTKALILTGFSFAIASVIPIIPFAFFDVTPAVIIAAVASIVTLFGVGSSKAIFTRKSWIRSGLEMMVIGFLASAVTYLIGLLFSI